MRTWALDREVFQNIMRRTAETRHEQYRNFLRRLAAGRRKKFDESLSQAVICHQISLHQKDKIRKQFFSDTVKSFYIKEPLDYGIK